MLRRRCANEQRWRGIFERLHEGFILGEIVRDADGRAIDWRYLQMNAAWERLTGMARSDAQGRTIRDVIPELEPGWVEFLAQVVDTGEPAMFTQHSASLGRNYEVHAFRSEPERFALIFLDVTERTRAQAERERLLQEVEAERERLAEVFRRAPSFMCVLTGPEHVVTLANDRYYQLIGHRDILNKTARQAFPEIEGQGLFELLDEVYRTGEPYIGSGIRVLLQREPDRPPEERFLDFVYQAFRGPDGTIIGVFAQGIDLTERILAEEALKEADRRKDQFLATLAHELRNPLAPISNVLQVWPLIEDDRSQTQQMRGLIDRQVRQMIRLIDDLLDVSRISRGKIELRKQRLDLVTILDGALEGVRPFVEQCEHALSVELPPQPVMLDGDAGRLMQVFANLINNAAKYTGHGGHIWITAAHEGRFARVSVRDDGPGIPADQLTAIFEMFAQVDQTLDRAHGGLGIGLTLVKTLVELHGGTVEAHSDGPGRGSEFVVRLPADATDETPTTAQQALSFEALALPPRRRVLVVDDLRPSANTLAMMLSGLGQQTQVAYDGQAAITAAVALRPEIVFLDIAMPGMDGYEVARQLRRAAGADLVLVALTGYGQEQDRQRAFAAGFDQHLVKPTTVDALHQLLVNLPMSS